MRRRVPPMSLRAALPMCRLYSSVYHPFFGEQSAEYSMARDRSDIAVSAAVIHKTALFILK
jgi:hypothetical protein